MNDKRMRGRAIARRAPVHEDRPGRPKKLRAIRLGDGTPSLPEMESELIDMTNILLGREEPPVHGVLALMETADAYYARASEMTMLLQSAERKGVITRGSAHYKFRTGELRTFLEMARRASELGSRRVTVQQMKGDAERTGRDTRHHDHG